MTRLSSLSLAPWNAALALLMAGPPAAAQVDELRACQQIAEAAARLACYDREVPRWLRQPASPAAQPAAGRAPPAPPAPVSAGAVAGGAAAEARFGLPAQPDGQATTRIESSLPDGFTGWRPGQRIRLANGQVWRIADDSSAFIQPASSRVVVRQGALGAFYLEFDGDRRSPRVRRVE